jgi:hypothetical protein
MNLKMNKIKIKNIRQMKTKLVIMEYEIRNDLQKFKDHLKLESFQRKTKEEKFSLNSIRHE